MFYRKDDLEAFLNCPKCGLRFQESKLIIPCQKTLCSACVDELTNRGRFDCFFCQVQHLIPEGGFSANATIESLLKLRPESVHRNLKLVDELEKKLSKMNGLNETLVKNGRGLESSLYDHCSLVKNQIDLISDRKIIQINTIREKYLKQVEDYLASSLKSIEKSRKLISNKSDEYQEYIENWNNYLRGYRLDDDVIKQVCAETERKIEQVELDIDRFKFNTGQISFKPYETEMADQIIGTITITNLAESMQSTNESLSRKYESLSSLSSLSSSSENSFKPMKSFNLTLSGSFNDLNERIVSASADQTIKVWNLKNGQCVKTLTGHTSYVNCLALVDNQIIVSGSKDKSLKIWNLNSQTCVGTLEGHTENVYCLLVIDRSNLASGSWDKTIKIWNLEKAHCSKTLEGHTDAVCCLSMINRNLLVSGSCDKTLRVWDINEEECIQTLKGHSSIVHGVSKIDSFRIVSGSYDKTIKIWDIASGECLATLIGHADLVYCVLKIDKNTIASGSQDKTIKLWNLDENGKSGRCIRTLQGHTGSVQCLSIVENNRLASGSTDNTVKLWNLSYGECVRTFEGHTEQISSLVSKALP